MLDQAYTRGRAGREVQDPRVMLDRLLDFTRRAALGHLHPREREDSNRLHVAVLAALRAAPVQQQEPVAYMVEDARATRRRVPPLLAWATDPDVIPWLSYPERYRVTPLGPIFAPPAQAAPTERERAEAALTELVEALRPFAVEAESWDAYGAGDDVIPLVCGDDESEADPANFSVRDLRRARDLWLRYTGRESASVWTPGEPVAPVRVPLAALSSPASTPAEERGS